MAVDQVDPVGGRKEEACVVGARGCVRHIGRGDGEAQQFTALALGCVLIQEEIECRKWARDT